VCGGSEAEVLREQRFLVPDELDVPDQLDIVCCLACGVGFADTAAAQERIDRTYREHSKYVDHGQAPVEAAPAAEPPWDLERLSKTADFLGTVVPDRSVRTLDAGCATGALLGFLKAGGFTDLVGIDPSPAAVAVARERHGVDARAESFTAPPPDLGRFGLVTLTHVFEHIGDLDVAIAKLAELLEAGGLAYVEVPDARHYVDHLVAPLQDFNTEHINHFSLPTLSYAMAAGGFEAVSTGEKVIGCSATDTYPAIYGVWRKAEDRAPRPAPVRDEVLVAALREYVAASDAQLARIDDQLRRELGDASEVAVWGAGQLGMKLLRDSALADLAVTTVVDSSPQKQGLKLGRWRIAAPADLAACPDAPIVVTSMLHDDAIEHSIRAVYALPNPIIRLAR
jgi:SAM-dependent methyltransferase